MFCAIINIQAFRSPSTTIPTIARFVCSYAPSRTETPVDVNRVPRVVSVANLTQHVSPKHLRRVDRLISNTTPLPVIDCSQMSQEYAIPNQMYYMVCETFGHKSALRSLKAAGNCCSKLLYALNFYPVQLGGTSGVLVRDCFRASSAANSCDPRDSRVLGLPGFGNSLSFDRWASSYGPEPISIYDGTKSLKLPFSKLPAWKPGHELGSGNIVLVGFKVARPSTMAKPLLTFVPEVVVVLVDIAHQDA